MNLPNKLTVLRMAMVPFFVGALLWQELPHNCLIALLLFLAASYTDHLDGKIARSRNLITNFGKFMDPLADKILVISALVCFVSLGLINPWWVLIIIAREFLVHFPAAGCRGRGCGDRGEQMGKGQDGQPDHCHRIDLGDAVCTGADRCGNPFRFLGGRRTGRDGFPVDRGSAHGGYRVFYGTLRRNLFKTELEGNRQFEIRKTKGRGRTCCMPWPFMFFGIVSSVSFEPV